MKILFASDIHGDLAAARAVVAAYRRLCAARLVLLGDILYHGPRNDLPAAYEPKGVISLLNGIRGEILAVRGNCDAEVDQMVLDFPILADFEVLPLGCGVQAYLTHGHRYSPESPMPMGARDLLIYGHTHVAGIKSAKTGQICLNPGSASMPKEGTPACYMCFDSDAAIFEIRRLADDALFASYSL